MTQTAIVTGASRGIGRSVAAALATTGRYQVLGIARSPIEIPDVDEARYDLADAHQASEASDDILTRTSGVVDVLVLNAGIGVFKPLDQMTPAEWHHVLAVNLTAPYLIVRGLLPAMKRRNFGRIVFISSDADHFTYPGAGAYCASKAGVAALAGCLRKEVADYNIHVSVISSGRVDTHFNQKQPGDRPDSLQDVDIARAILTAISQPPGCELERIECNSAYERMLH